MEKKIHLKTPYKPYLTLTFIEGFRSISIKLFNDFKGNGSSKSSFFKAICNTMERDLREVLGEKELPPKLQPVEGYLW